MNSQFVSFKDLLEKTTANYSSLAAFSFKSGFRTKTYTYQEVYVFLKKLPTFFKQFQIKAGDKVIVLSLNRPEYSVLILGLLASGIVIVPVDYRTNRETVRKFIETTRPKAVFTTGGFKELFKGYNCKIYFLENFFEEVGKVKTGTLPSLAQNYLAAILFTSGTTGEPKGTVITRNNIIASVNNIRKVFYLDRGFRVLSVLPLSHALEMFGGLLTTYSLGCHIHYIERINSITISQTLRRYRIQGMAVVPQMLRILLENLERKIKLDKNENKWKIGQKVAPYLPFLARRILFNKLHQNLGGSFSLFACGSAPLEFKLAQIWQNTGINVVEGYGASETTGFVSTNTISDNHLGTVGKIIDGVDFKLSPDAELMVAGENVVSGYFNNEEKTKESFRDGWFKTGDIVSIDNKGLLRIIGRDKFKIVLPDGKKVYPEDVERKINDHQEVVDSAVFGIPGDDGELVHAEIILKNPDKIRKVVDEVNQRLNPHEQIMDFDAWKKNDFPRTKTLKIDRSLIRQEVIDKKNNNFSKDNAASLSAEDSRLDQILIAISGSKNMRIDDKMVLSSDLKFDSLKRIELLAMIEEELDVSVDELKITPLTTVLDLKNLVKNGSPVVIEDDEKISSWQFSETMDEVRVTLQKFISFPLFNIAFKIKVINPENLERLANPQLFIFNHVGVYDVMNILRILPEKTKRRLAIAATAQLWHEILYERYFAQAFGNAFPFVKAESHRAMRGNFDRVGQILDMGYNILISPEGNITHTGKLLPFHTGAGYIAVEMKVPVVPFKINGYYQLWPEKQTRKLNKYWPERFGNVEVVVGKPIIFKPGTAYEEATETLRQTLIDLK